MKPKWIKVLGWILLLFPILSAAMYAFTGLTLWSQLSQEGPDFRAFVLIILHIGTTAVGLVLLTK